MDDFLFSLGLLWPILTALHFHSFLAKDTELNFPENMEADTFPLGESWNPSLCTTDRSGESFYVKVTTIHSKAGEFRDTQAFLSLICHSEATGTK